MDTEMGLLDEVFGVFIGASFTLTFFNPNLIVPARVGPLILGLFLIPGLLVTVKFDNLRKRYSNYLAWFFISLGMALVMIFRLEADAIASFSLSVGIAFWAISREVVRLAD